MATALGTRSPRCRRPSTIAPGPGEARQGPFATHRRRLSASEALASERCALELSAARGALGLPLQLSSVRQLHQEQWLKPDRRANAVDRLRKGQYVLVDRAALRPMNEPSQSAVNTQPSSAAWPRARTAPAHSCPASSSRCTRRESLPFSAARARVRLSYKSRRPRRIPARPPSFSTPPRHRRPTKPCIVRRTLRASSMRCCETFLGSEALS